MKRAVQHDENGKFCSPNPEPLGKKIVGVRLPASIEAQLRSINGKDLSAFIREAIAEKLERDLQQSA